MIIINMTRARAIHLARIRAARDAELARLDGQELRAMSQERGEELREIRAKKQMLRDIPEMLDLEAITTPEALAAMWPEGLPR